MNLPPNGGYQPPRVGKRQTIRVTQIPGDDQSRPFVGIDPGPPVGHAQVAGLIDPGLAHLGKTSN